eukprot:3941821-Rhodomonas_salina.7
MSGTEIGYGVLRRTEEDAEEREELLRKVPIVLGLCYEMSGTDLGYLVSSSAFVTPCPVLACLASYRPTPLLCVVLRCGLVVLAEGNGSGVDAKRQTKPGRPYAREMRKRWGDRVDPDTRDIGVKYQGHTVDSYNREIGV